jgi:hypothetical protein
MRRDLAGLREESNPQKSEPAKLGVIPKITASENDAPVVQEPDVLAKPADSEPAVVEVEAEAEAKPFTPEVKVDPVVDNPDPEPEPDLLDVFEDHLNAEQKAESPPAAEKLAPAETETEPNAPDTALQLDTKTEKPEESAEKSAAQSEDEKPPDTANTSEGRDLESLFNDPMSAGGAAVDDNPDFTAGFDFGTFNAGLNDNTGDNNDLSSLLPGVQDYASMQPSGTDQPDFDALFAADVPMGEDSQQQHQSEQQSFDDLLNFGDFGAGDFSGGGEADGNNNNNQDFDFNFD